MFTADLRARFLKACLIICLFSLVLVLLVVLAQPVSACQIEKLDSLVDLYTAGTGGVSLNHRHLRSDCFMVVYFLSPHQRRSSVVYSDQYEAFVSVIGGKRKIFLGRSNYRLVRYQMFETCPAAIEAAHQFAQEMTHLGLFSVQPGQLTEARICSSTGA